MNSKLILIPLLFIIAITFANAYNVNDLVHYYSFDSPSTTSILYDSKGTNNLIPNYIGVNYNTSLQQGISGTSIYWNSYVANMDSYGNAYLNGFTYYNTTFSQAINNFTINFWIKDSTITNIQFILGIGKSNAQLNYGLLPYPQLTNGHALKYYNVAKTSFLTYPTTTNYYTNNALPTNIFTMVTLTYDTTTKLLKYYEAGTLSNTFNTTGGTIYPNLTTLFIGDIYLSAMDELSIFKVALNDSDIEQLYNQGFGLSYNQTANITPVEIIPKCLPINYCNLQPNNACGNFSIDGSHEYCSNPILNIYGEITCNFVDILNCPQGCFENNGVATCENIFNCNNTCNIWGAKNCYDSTRVSTCDNWNNNGCYSYQTSQTCNVGEFCLESSNYFASCVNVTQNGTHGVYGLSVLPYSTNSIDTSYKVDTANKIVSVTTTYPIHRQDFYTTGTNYFGRTCDYKETPIYTQSTIEVANTTIQSNQIITNTPSSDSIIKFRLTTDKFAEGFITITDTVGSVNNQLFYKRNSTSKSFCIYEVPSLSIIYCDYSTNTYDDLTSVDFEFNYAFASKTTTTKIIFNRNIINPIIIGTQLFMGSNIYMINITNYINETQITQTTLVNVPSFPSITSATLDTAIIQVENPNCDCGTLTCSEYRNVRGQQAYFDLCLVNQTIPVFKLPCDYESTGTYKVRTYGNNIGTPDYSVYQDYVVQVNALATTEEVVSDEQGTTTNGITQSERQVLWAYGLTLGLSLLIAGILGFLTMRSERMGAVIILSFLMSTLTGFVLFGSIGWISSVYAIILSIVDVIFIVIAFKMLFFSTPD